MGKTTLLLLFCMFLANSWACDHSGDDDLRCGEDGDSDDIVPSAIVTKPHSSMDEDGGDASAKSAKRVKRVIGGHFANPADFPHQISLQVLESNGFYKHFCSASIIHPLLLLSAALCVEHRKNSSIRAYAGVRSISRRGGDAQQVRDVVQVVTHKKYNGTSQDNGITILVLNESLKLNDYVRAVQVRDPNWQLPGHANISGWGKTELHMQSDVLKVAQVPMVDNGECAAAIPEYVPLRNSIADSTICAGGKGADICIGDSGGPLTCTRIGIDGEEERYLCGIASWGFPCKRQKGRLPSVYTDVSKYTGWILKFMRTWWSHYWRNVGKPSDRRRDCRPGKFQCPNNGLCIPEKWKCNGKNDCNPLEDWDETNCTKITCGLGNFQCNSTRTCIFSEYMCDGDEDCDDGSDELDCKSH